MLRAFAILPFATLFAIAAPDPPQIPKMAYERAVKADIAQLQKHLEICAGDAKAVNRTSPTAKAMTGMLIRYAEALGDDAPKSQAIKVGRKIDAKDWKGAMKEVEGFATAKADPALLKEALPEFSLEVVSSPFRAMTVGGLNIDHDIRDMIKTDKPKPIVPVEVELLAVRTSVLAELHPTTAPPDLRVLSKEWPRAVEHMRASARELAVEAAKGEKANLKELRSVLSKLHVSCGECHASIHNE